MAAGRAVPGQGPARSVRLDDQAPAVVEQGAGFAVQVAMLLAGVTRHAPGLRRRAAELLRDLEHLRG